MSEVNRVRSCSSCKVGNDQRALVYTGPGWQNGWMCADCLLSAYLHAKEAEEWCRRDACAAKQELERLKQPQPGGVPADTGAMKP